MEREVISTENFVALVKLAHDYTRLYHETPICGVSSACGTPKIQLTSLTALADIASPKTWEFSASGDYFKAGVFVQGVSFYLLFEVGDVTALQTSEQDLFEAISRSVEVQDFDVPGSALAKLHQALVEVYIPF
jgi:hypothetical protein